MPAPKTAERYWTLQQPRSHHEYLAYLVAQGVTRRADLAEAVGLSPQQISRVTNSPLFKEMVCSARLDLLEADRRSQQPLTSKMAEETAKAIQRLAFLRDFGPRSLAFRSASTLLKQAFKTAPPNPTPPDPVHILVIKRPDSPAVDAGADEGPPIQTSQ